MGPDILQAVDAWRRARRSPPDQCQVRPVQALQLLSMCMMIVMQENDGQNAECQDKV
jgi:hypothetical protein